MKSVWKLNLPIWADVAAMQQIAASVFCKSVRYIVNLLYEIGVEHSFDTARSPVQVLTGDLVVGSIFIRE